MSYITGTINGISVEGKCVSLARQHHLCNPNQVATLVLSPSFTDAITPGMDVVLYENATKVITGYVVKVIKSATDATITVEIHDTYHRVSMTFIEEKITTGYDENDQPIQGYTPLTTAYWIGYLCGLAGISYSIDSGTAYNVPAGVQLGLRTVHESLTDILAYSSQACYVDANGVLRIIRVTRNVATRTFTECIEINDSTGDEMTRNVIKVFGYQGVTNRIFSSASQSVIGVVPDRVAAVGSPMIQTQAEADRVANFLVGELGVQTRIVSIRIPGDPTVTLATVARINFETTDYTDAITSIDSVIDQNGYTTVVTIGERCPRISGWSLLQMPVYAGTSGSGVYRSMDNGATWAEFNTGLPAGSKFVKKLSFNSFGEGMCIVNGGLYHTTGDSWSSKSLPSPINMSGDSPPLSYGALISVGALGTSQAFGVLTTNPNSSGSNVQQSRAWYYETSDAGATWTSTQLQTSGSGWHAIGIDLSSELGAPYILLSSGSIYAGIPATIWARKDSVNRITNPCSDNVLNHGIIDFQFGNMWITGTSPNRTLMVQLYLHGEHLDPNGLFRYQVFGVDKKGYGLNERSEIFVSNVELSDHTGFTPGFFSSYAFSATNTSLDPIIVLQFSENTYGSVFEVRFSMFNQKSAVDLVGDIMTGEPECFAGFEDILQRPFRSWLSAGSLSVGFG